MRGHKLGGIGVAILVFCLGACRCGDRHETDQGRSGSDLTKTKTTIELVDLTTLIPDSVHLAFLSNQPYKVWAWLNQKPWFQKDERISGLVGPIVVWSYL